MLAPTRRPAGQRLAESMLAPGAQFADVNDFHRWLAGLADRSHMYVSRVPIDEVNGWARDAATGNIGHHSGRFFTVECLDVDLPGAPVPQWSQPIINQPDIGILGILVKEIDGVLHCLMQAKHEPGNHNGLQLSPTVQATRSNYTRVHQGKEVPYLDYFRDTSGHTVVADIRQSEQGAWFYRKRNRNVIIEVDGDVELVDGFCWLTLRQIGDLMSVPDLVNMDARTVLACVPFSGADLAGALRPNGGDRFSQALVHSFDPTEPSLCTTGDVLSWITEMRSRTLLRVELEPLDSVRGWHRVDGRISHETGRFFDVIGVDVEAGGREVASWAQPMIEPVGTGVIAFLVKPIDGVLHVLMHARTEPGYADVTELGPTVQCTPENVGHLPRNAGSRFLDEALAAGPDRIRFDTVLSEEGGRFFGARNRYVVVETDLPARLDDPDYRWLTMHQLTELLRHSFYVNIQARSLVVCLTSLLRRPRVLSGE
jgi:dTDP-4-dehydro-6-deoxy-alpha-D-glucopyranose 2,3-dehydratase